MTNYSHPWMLLEIQQRHDELVTAARNESLAREFTVSSTSSTDGATSTQRLGWLRRLFTRTSTNRTRPAGSSSTAGTAGDRPAAARPAPSQSRDAHLVGR